MKNIFNHSLFFSYASEYEYIYVLRFKVEIIFYITSFSVQIFEVVPTRQIIIMTRKRVPPGNGQMFEMVSDLTNNKNSC